MGDTLYVSLHCHDSEALKKMSAFGTVLITEDLGSNHCENAKHLRDQNIRGKYGSDTVQEMVAIAVRP